MSYSQELIKDILNSISSNTSLKIDEAYRRLEEKVNDLGKESIKLKFRIEDLVRKSALKDLNYAEGLKFCQPVIKKLENKREQLGDELVWFKLILALSKEIEVSHNASAKDVIIPSVKRPHEITSDMTSQSSSKASVKEDKSVLKKSKTSNIGFEQIAKGRSEKGRVS